jgi:CHAT domain-containing protein
MVLLTRPGFKSPALVVRGGLLLIFGSLLLVTPNRQSQALSYSRRFSGTIAQELKRDALPLNPGEPIQRKLAGGEIHPYEVKAMAQQFLQVSADQQGIDIGLAFYDPSGKKVLEVNNRRSERASETASLIATETGVYRIEITSMRMTDRLGSYLLKLEVPRMANDRDRTADVAEHLVADANALRSRQARDLVPQAIARYKEALALWELAGDLPMKAVVLNLVGRCYFSLGEYRHALEYHQQALPLARGASDLQAEAATLTYLGDGYRLTTENENALANLNQAIQGWQTIQDRRGEADALNILARVYFQMGDQYKAISNYDRALLLSRTLSDQSKEIETLGGMGLSYYALGENEKAVEIWEQELTLIRTSGQTGLEANVLSKLGSAHNQLGNNQEALDYHYQAIKLARERGDRVDEAGSLQSIGRVYRSIGEPRKSIEYLEQSLLVLKDVNNPPTSVARAHYNLGKAYTDLGEYEKAIDYLNQALLVWKTRSDVINCASTIRELARAERGRGNLETALTQSEAALSLIESLRSGAGGSEARATYLASVQDYFELKISVLMRLQKQNPSGNYGAAALQTSERARARSLLETLAEAGVDIRRGVTPDLLKREQTTAEALSGKAAEQARLLGNRSAGSALNQINRELKDLTTRYESIEAEIRTASPRYAELMQVRPLSLAEIREQVIDSRTVLVEYYLGVEHSYLWAVSSSSIETYELPPRDVIERAARNVYESLTARNHRVKFETVDERRARIAKADARYPDDASALSRIVLEPLAGRLANQRLLIVSDGALQYVPFSALPNPASSSHEPLSATNEVVSLPSASTLGILRQEIAKRQPPPKTIAVIADPVFNENDRRVKDALAANKLSLSESTNAGRRVNLSKSEIQRSAGESGWEGEPLAMARLPFTRREAEAIEALVPAAYRKQELDFAANLTNATSADLSQYRIVHFATHGFLNSRHPELSGLVLSLVDERGREQDGFLRAHQIYGLKIPADLVVLSGCRTGLGKEIRGEGLIGITRGFMHAGAARVLVSLWDVNDEATAELMTRFYARVLGPVRMSPAAALRAAQVSMIQDKRWAFPYFWAGFTLPGEPR